MATRIIPHQSKLHEQEIHSVLISDLFSDPDLRRFFRDGERDRGFPLCIPDPDSPVFDGGAEAELDEVA